MYTRPTLVPYVTVIGSDGREIQSAAASRYEPSEAIWRDLARHWVQMVRRVGHDPFVMEQDIRWAYERTRSEEHTSELQSLMRISYAVFCLKKKKIRHRPTIQNKT